MTPLTFIMFQLKANLLETSADHHIKVSADYNSIFSGKQALIGHLMQLATISYVGVVLYQILVWAERVEIFERT